MISNYKNLVKSPLFIGLDFEQILDALNGVHYQIKKFGSDNIIAYGGDTLDKLYIVLSGSVKGEMIDFSGKVVKIEDIEPPRPLAIAFLFGHNNKYPVNIVSNEDTVLLMLPKSSVLKLLMKNETILLNYLNTISNRSQFLSQKIRFLSFQTVKGKIANYLLQLSKGEAKEITLSKSQNELAELFAVTRPSVGRAMRELHQEGIISAKGKTIKIIDLKALKENLK